jgi:hypothetical protein
MREKRNAYRVLVEKPAGNRPSWRSRRRWEDNIKIDVRELGWSCMDWTCLSLKVWTNVRSLWTW